MAKYTKKGKKGLKGNQWKLDRNRNGELDKQDFKMMRKGKKGKKKGKKK
tara:strand:- start:828 stop:974 length:147 start_codon:yes stop_codon:yes gene_type:complete